MTVSPEVAVLFVAELERREIPIELVEDGVYQIDVGDALLTISLKNLSREFDTDRDPQRVTDFVHALTQPVVIPDWSEAKARIRWSLEPADMPLDEALHDLVSDQLARVVVYVTPDESRVTWVTESTAERWGQTKEALAAIAGENMIELMTHAEIEFETIDGAKLGMINSEFIAFKAAMVFSPGFKELVEPILGWPVFALVPCRDFVFVIPAADRDLIDRVGGIVVQEYLESAYQLCTEVFELNDEGIGAIGEFDKVPPPEAELDEDGMKTISYQNAVTFRLPGHWEDDIDEAGGIYFNGETELGTLRVSVLRGEGETPNTADSSREMAELWAKSENGTAIDLGDGTWMAEYENVSEEDGKSLTIRYWQFAYPVPPKDMLVAIFSYSVYTELLDQDDVIEEIAMVEEEIVKCQFGAP